MASPNPTITAVVNVSNDPSSNFIRLTPSLVSTLSGASSQAPSFLPVELKLPLPTTPSSPSSISTPAQTFYSSFNGGVLTENTPHSLSVELPQHVAASMSLSNGNVDTPTHQEIEISLVSPSPAVASSVTLSPVDIADWEMISLNAEALEEVLLSHFSVLFPNQVMSLPLPSTNSSSRATFTVSMQVTSLGSPALLKAATELIIEPKGRGVLPASFPPSPPVRLLPTVDDAKREIPDFSTLWSSHHPLASLYPEAPHPLTIHVDPSQLHCIPGFSEMSKQNPNAAPLAAIYKWDPADAKKAPAYSYGSYRSQRNSKPVQYVNVEMTAAPLCPPPFSVSTPPSAVLPASLRYALNCSVFDCVQIKMLTPEELLRVSKLGEGAAVKVEGNYGFAPGQGSPSKRKAKLPCTAFTSTILFDDSDHDLARCTKVTVTPSKEGNASPPALASASKKSSDVTLPPLLYLPLPVATSTAPPPTKPPKPASSDVFTLTPQTKAPAIGEEQLSSVQALYDDVYESFTTPPKDPNQPPPCHLLVGAEGSGKTHVALNLALKLRLSPLNLASVYVDFKALQINHPKMSDVLAAITARAKEALKSAPSLLVLDNVDTLAPFIDDKDAQVMNLSMMMDQGDLVADHVIYIVEEIARAGGGVGVLITAKAKDRLNALLSNPDYKRLRQPRVLQNYDGPDRTALFSHLLEANGYAIPADFDADKFALDTESCLPIDLVRLIEMIKHNLRLRFLGRFGAEKGEAKTVVCQADIDRALKNFSPSTLKGAKLHKGENVDWDDIGGLFEAKKKLIEVFENPIKYRKIFENSPIKLPKGGILHGPTGCGKTLLGSAIAKKANLNFISVKGPELLDKFIGASEAAVRSVFTRASQASPCLIFFDEFESLAPKRGNDSTGVTDRVVNQLLTFLDGVEVSEGEVFVLAATSRMDMIDAALLRPGRLDLKVEVALPTSGERVDILRKIVKKNGMNVQDGVLETIISQGLLRDDHNPADLSAICNSAYLAAVHEAIRGRRAGEVGKEDVIVSEKHFLDAIIATKPSSVKIAEEDQFGVGQRVAFH